MSGTFQQVMHELGIKQYKSSVYHPESPAALGRFNQTLKITIKSYCQDDLLSESLYKSLLCSVHFSLYLGILFVDLMKDKFI